MYFIGHFAIAYFILRLLDRRTFRDPLMFPTIMVFASFPDIMHIVNMRHLAHNFLGTAGIVLLGVIALYLFKVFNRKQLGLIFIAGFSHFIGDIVFGSYYPFGPFSFRSVTLFEFESPIHLYTEIILISMSITVFHLSGEHRTFREWSGRVIHDFKQKMRADQLFLGSFYPFLILYGYLSISVLEPIIYFRRNWSDIGSQVIFWTDLVLMVYVSTILFHGHLFGLLNRKQSDPAVQ